MPCTGRQDASSHAQESFLPLSGHKSMTAQRAPLAGTTDLGSVPELAPALSVTRPVTATSGLSLAMCPKTQPNYVLSQVPLSIWGLE